MCVTRQCWRWEFLSSDTNVSAVHPVDGVHAKADGVSGPLLIKGKTSPKNENSVIIFHPHADGTAGVVLKVKEV